MAFFFQKRQQNGIVFVGKAEKNYREFVESNGTYPANCDMDWEDMNSMRKRILPVLEKYKHHQKIIVACHGMFIQSLCDGYHPKNGEGIEFEL